MAIWALHGQHDLSVSSANEEATMPKLIACPQPSRRDAIFTLVPDAGHNIWTDSYEGSEGDVYVWLLAQRFER